MPRTVADGDQLDGTVAKLFPTYCWIRGDDGLRYFAHAGEVIDPGFEALLDGDRVTFLAYPGFSKGPRASEVQRIERRGPDVMADNADER